MKISLITVTLLLSILAGTACAQQVYTNVIAFGDSLSDTGNLSSATIPFPYPFYNNRISDGPVALDYFTESLGFNAEASLHLLGSPLGFNYAVAGGNILGTDSEDLAPQIDAHLNRVSAAVDTNALYVVIMGGNDLRDLRSVADEAAAHDQITVIIDHLLAQLNRLSSAGAEYLYISNVANIGRIPETLQREVTDPGIRSRATRYTQHYNDSLALKLTEFSQQTGAKIRIFDQYKSLEGILDDPAEFGFDYSEEGCFADFEFHPGCLFGTRFDRFVFFDNLHPSNATNQLIAGAMLSRLDEPDIATQANRLPIGAIMLLLND